MVARAQYSGGALQIALTVYVMMVLIGGTWCVLVVKVVKKNYKNVLLALGKTLLLKKSQVKTL